MIVIFDVARYNVVRHDIRSNEEKQKNCGKETDMKMDIAFRQGNMEDLPEIVNLVQAAIVQMESCSIMQWDEIYPTAEDFASDISKGQLFVGMINGNIAVVYTLNTESDEEYRNGKWRMPQKSYIVLHRLCVHPKYQNQGIARKTMQYIEQQVIGLGIDAIRLDAFSQNPYSLKLYQRCGYAEVGTAVWRKGTFYLMEKYL